MKSVCVIGGGPGGLSALKSVSEISDFNVVLFERARSIGGVWRDCEKNERFPTPVYPNLKMNTPHLICQFTEFPWPENTQTFPSRKDALNYLENYAIKFNLKDHIYFNTEVVEVNPIDPTSRENPRWSVAVKDLGSGNVTTHEFDVVLVCTGHEMETNFPVIPNIDQFKGTIVTADKYTVPQVYSGKRVLVLGGGPSSIDISMAVLPFAKETIVSCKPLPKIFSIEQKFPLGIRKVAPWKSATTNGFVLEDNTELDGIDVLIIATGYDYNYGFLAPSCGISLENGKRVNFLYRHMVNVKFPTMYFVGITFYSAVFYMLSVQINWITSVIKGKVKLPTESEMMMDIQKSRQGIIDVGLNEFSFAHNICIEQWSLFEELAKEGDFALNPYAKQIWTYLLPRIFTDPANFRKDIYKKIDENTLHIETVTNTSEDTCSVKNSS